MFPLGWMSEFKTDPRGTLPPLSYYRPCGFLATLGLVGLVGVLAATGADAAMFTMKEDYGYGAMTGGYREKHVRKSRGEERSNVKHQTKSRGDGNASGTMAGPMAADDEDYGGPYPEELLIRTNTAMTRIQATGRIKHHSAGHGAPDGGDKGHGASNKAKPRSAAPTAGRRSNETARLHARRLSGAKLNVARLNARRRTPRS